jgi:hypothetical protein
MKETTVSKISVMEQLHSDWLTAKAAWEQGQKEVNDMMLLFCLGKGRVPSRKKLNAVALLLQEMCETQRQLDKFMRENISSPASMKRADKQEENVTYNQAV